MASVTVFEGWWWALPGGWGSYGPDSTGPSVASQSGAGGFLPPSSGTPSPDITHHHSRPSRAFHRSRGAEVDEKARRSGLFPFQKQERGASSCGHRDRACEGLARCGVTGRAGLSPEGGHGWPPARDSVAMDGASELATGESPVRTGAPHRPDTQPKAQSTRFRAWKSSSISRRSCISMRWRSLKERFFAFSSNRYVSRSNSFRCIFVWNRFSWYTLTSSIS